MRYYVFFVIFGLLILLFASQCPSAESTDLRADQIMAKVAENIRSVKFEEVTIEVTVEDNGRKETFVEKFQAAYAEKEDKIRIDIVSGSKKGLKVLQIGYSHWSYDPRAPEGRRLRRLAGIPRFQKVFGTDFVWIDLQIMEHDEWEFKMEPKDTLYWYIKSIPLEKGEYAFVQLVIPKNQLFPIVVHYHNRKGELSKHLLITHEVMNGPRPREMVMEVREDLSTTILKFRDRKIGLKIPDEIFNPQSLGR
jgi:outer membrane lipoprotein-sorting protein